ncbi:MAG TPA: hypothetical protein VGE40_09540 [Bacilli bacterium]
MGQIHFDSEKITKLIMRDSFLTLCFETMIQDRERPEILVLEIIFNTYVLGDSVMERKYLGC